MGRGERVIATREKGALGKGCRGGGEGCGGGGNEVEGHGGQRKAGGNVVRSGQGKREMGTDEMCCRMLRRRESRLTNTCSAVEISLSMTKSPAPPFLRAFLKILRGFHTELRKGSHIETSFYKCTTVAAPHPAAVEVKWTESREGCWRVFILTDGACASGALRVKAG